MMIIINNILLNPPLFSLISSLYYSDDSHLLSVLSSLSLRMRRLVIKVSIEVLWINKYFIGLLATTLSIVYHYYITNNTTIGLNLELSLPDA
mmetsp:Transcript_9308/g.7765  ORF Transcript_9308/g.7765 Transcript_9308/m.7765 type:complete len:92 (+) Transcript_9308:74-349(+)